MKEVNANEFNKEIATGTTLVDIWAPWCVPCRTLAPVLEKISEENSNVNIIKSNADQNIEICNQYGIRSLPTMLIFKEGQLVDRIVGAAPKQEIENMLSKHS